MNFCTGSMTSTCSETVIRKFVVTRPMPAPQSATSFSFDGGGGSVELLELEVVRRSLLRNVREPAMSMRDTCGKPPSMPETVDGVEDQ